MLLLSGSGILEDTVNALGFNLSSAFHLQPFPYMLKKGRAFAHVPQSVRQASLNDCSKISPLSAAPDPKAVADLANILDIDAGEAAIFGVMYKNPVFYMASGDKRCMRALARAGAVDYVRNSIAGRVICLEKICLELISTYDVATVASRLAPVASTHKGLSSYFSPGNVAYPSRCHNAITRDFQYLRREVGEDFLWNEGKHRIP